MRFSRAKRAISAIAIASGVASSGMVASGAIALVGAVPASASTNCPYRFAVITHGDNGNFWSVVYKGAKDAAKDFGCTLTEVYGSQQQGQAQPETLAGQQAGARFKSQHLTNVLCVIHQSGQNLLDRCNGLATGLGVKACKTGSAPAKGPACTELILSTPNAASNPTQAIGQVTAYLQAHPGIQAVMTLNTAIGDALVATSPKAKVATFDLDATVQTDIKTGKMDFAVDQQQYLQGYLPIAFLYLYNKHHGNATGGGSTVASGPLLVDKTNIGKVAAAIAAGED
jgi:ABC-type sugar transport system substrate-binding protein